MILKIIKLKGETKYIGLVQDLKGGIHKHIDRSEEGVREWLKQYTSSKEIHYSEI